MSSKAPLGPKEQGDLAFGSRLFHDAVRFYSQALESSPDSAVLYSNRSATYASLQMFQEALKDAEKCIKLKPDWSRGYTRKGLSLFYMGQLEEAVDCYSQGLAVDPGNLHICEALGQLSSLLDNQQHPFASLLKDANIVKLMAHSRTSSFFLSQDFHDMLNAIRANPSSASEYMKDSRLTEVVNVLLGSSECSEKPKADPRREAAEAQKVLGNSAYRQKRFGDALGHYEAAHELDPSNVTYVTNMSAVYFEKKDYEKCVEKCEEAIALGRETGSSGHQISRAMTRQGDALLKLGQIDAGIEALNKSLLENRDDTVKQKIKAATVLKCEQRAKEAAECANEEANVFFAKRKYRKAKELYSKALELNEHDARYWLNRSACDLKLGDLAEALSDVEHCLLLEPCSSKALCRKALVVAHMGNREQAELIIRELEEIDGQNVTELRMQLNRLMNGSEERSSQTSES